MSLTCWSCHHWSERGCTALEDAWPDGGPAVCPSFSYEPGTDEAERAAQVGAGESVRDPR